MRIAFVLAVAAICACARPASAIDVPPPGATACSGCHATSRSAATSVARLVGRDPEDILKAMQEFRAGRRPATVMDRIAKGFTDDEISAIADWYAEQKD